MYATTNDDSSLFTSFNLHEREQILIDRLPEMSWQTSYQVKYRG